MKSKLRYLVLIVFLPYWLSAKDFEEILPDTVLVYDTLVIYDTVMVYDTVIVYDTVSTYDNKLASDTIQIVDTNKSNLSNSVSDKKSIPLSRSSQELHVENKSVRKGIKRIIVNNRDTTIAPENETLEKDSVSKKQSKLVSPNDIYASHKKNKSSPIFDPKSTIIGIGVSSNYVFEGYGANFKFGFLITPKINMEIRSTLTGISWDNFTYVAPNSAYSGIAVEYSNGTTFFVGVNTTYYITGGNGNIRNGGVFVTFGIGYSKWKMSERVTQLNNYYKFSSDFGNKSLVGILGLGADRNLGSGKLYFEIPLTFDIYGTEENKYYDQEGINKPSTSITGFQQLAFGFFLNLGYQYYF